MYPSLVSCNITVKRIQINVKADCQDTVYKKTSNYFKILIKNDGKMKWHMALGAGSVKHPCRANFVRWSRLSVSCLLSNLFPVNVRHTPVCSTVHFCFVILYDESWIYKVGVSIELQRMVTQPEPPGILFWSQQCSTTVYQGLVLLPTCVPKKMGV